MNNSRELYVIQISDFLGKKVATFTMFEHTKVLRHILFDFA